MLSIRAATIAAILILAIIPLCARAQTPPPPPSPSSTVPPPATQPADATSPVTLPPVTVTAGRGSDIEKLDVSTTVLTRDQVQAMPETTVDQILNRIPGIWSSTIPTNELHPTGQPFSIRGFGTSTTINTLVMVDGVPMNDPYFRTVDWTTVPKASIERIEIIRGGGATSLWGNMAMGGVVNIITKEPTKTGGEADAGYGNFNTFTTEAFGAYAPSAQIKASVDYSHQQSDGYNLTPLQYQNSNLVNTSSHGDNVTFATYLNPSESLKLFAKAYYHQTFEDGLTWVIASNQWSSYRLLLGGTYKIDEESAINFSGWLGGGVFGTTNASSGSYTLVKPNFLNQFVNQREAAPNTNYGGSVFYQLDVGQFRDVKIGADARVTYVLDNIALYGSATGNPNPFVNQGQHQLEGAFAQGTYKFEAIPLDVTVGLRGDFYQAVNASSLIQNTGSYNRIPDSFYSYFDPRVGFKYYLTNEITLRGAAYQNFSEAGMNQMYRSFASGTSFTVTNPMLQPMTNTGEEGGFDFAYKGFTLSATYFNNNVSNFIDFIKLCNTNAACAAPFVANTGLTGVTTINQYNNVGNATFQGFEIIAGWQPIQQLKLRAGFTQTYAYLTNSVFPLIDPVNAQIGQVPPWTVTAGAEWRPLPELAFNAALRSFPVYYNDTGHTQLNEGATIVDLGATYSVNKSLDMYGVVQNLFNVQYLAQGYTTTSFEGSTVSTTSIPALGQPLTFFFGLRARF